MADQGKTEPQTPSVWSGYLLVSALALGVTACSPPPVERSAQAQPPSGARSERPAVVDVATAQAGPTELRVYTGTTRPARQVALRSQTEGRLLALSPDVGDLVQWGEVVGRLDDTLLQTAQGEAQAELAARQFEVSRVEAELADIRTTIELAQVRLNQARSEAQRLQTLASQGAVSTQDVEQAQITVRAAEQALQSAQEQVRTRQQAIAAAQQRVEAQRSILRESQQRLSFADLTAPLAGVVLERLAEPGDLILPGEAVLTLGDLSAIRVVIEVADSSLGDFSLGQSLPVQLDAFPGENFTGQVSRISPVADSTSRLVPIELTVANPGGRIGSGLLARVSSPGAQAKAVVVPQSVLDIGTSEEPHIFVVKETNGTTQVEARSVRVGDRADGQVTILSGLALGERYVVRSSQPLESGQTVQLSLLSES